MFEEFVDEFVDLNCDVLVVVSILCEGFDWVEMLKVEFGDDYVDNVVVVLFFGD